MVRYFKIFCLIIAFAFVTQISVASAKVPVCKSKNGTFGQWQFVVSADDGDTSLLIQMFRKKQFDLRFEFITQERGYFGIRGKKRGAVSEANLFIDDQPAASYKHNPKSDKPADPSWRRKDYASIYQRLIKGRSGKVEIRLNSGEVTQFDIALKDYHRAYNAAVPLYNQLSKLYSAKKCQGAFDSLGG